MVPHDDTASPDATLDASIAELDKAYEEFKWAYVQLKYERYLSSFSPAYLSGCDWYQILGDDFRKGYYNYALYSFTSSAQSDVFDRTSN